MTLLHPKPNTSPTEMWVLLKRTWLAKGRYYLSTKGRIYDAQLNRYRLGNKTQVNGYKCKTKAQSSKHYYMMLGLMSLYKDKAGHYRPNTTSIHRLLAEEFIPKPKGKHKMTEVNHIDGNPLNNALSNLEWCSRRENTQVLDAKQVYAVLCRLAKQHTNITISRELNVPYYSVRNIATKPIWMDLKAKYNKRAGKCVFATKKESYASYN